MRNPFRYFNSSPEVIGLAVMMYIRYPLLLRQVEGLLHERGKAIDEASSVCPQLSNDRLWLESDINRFANEGDRFCHILRCTSFYRARL